nr:hypothetical protein [Granulicella arctica]
MGKLSYTWPRDAGQIPIVYGHNTSHKPYDAEGFTSRYWDTPTSAQYPFGFPSLLEADLGLPPLTTSSFPCRRSDSADASTWHP